MLALGFLRILYNLHIKKIFTILYFIVFLLAYFTPTEFMAISFDASGATTGAVTVPFILALAAGVSVLKKDSKASEIDSFGMVGIASVGAIIGHADGDTVKDRETHRGPSGQRRFLFR